MPAFFFVHRTLNRATRNDRMKTLTPSPFLTGVTAYKTPLAATPVDLFLNGNEGIAPPSEVLEAALRAGVEAVRRYPDNTEIESLIGKIIL